MQKITNNISQFSEQTLDNAKDIASGKGQTRQTNNTAEWSVTYNCKAGSIECMFAISITPEVFL